MVGLLLATGIILYAFLFSQQPEACSLHGVVVFELHIIERFLYYIFWFCGYLIEKNMVKDGNVTIMMVVTLY